MPELELKMGDGRISLLRDGDEVSWLNYVEDDQVHLLSVHTVEGEEGEGYASELVERALPELAGEDGVKVSCPFVRYWAEKNDYDGDLEFTTLSEVKSAAREFNRYHSPEAVLEIKGFEGREVYAEMTGPFCTTCGGYDYLEDIIYEHELDAEVSEYVDIEDGMSVTYRFEEEVA